MISHKFPFEEQPDTMDCGSCCLKMIASFYGRDYTLDKLRAETGAGISGVSLRGIAKAAETLGFKTVGGLVSFDTMVTKAILPCIVHWDQNHFVLVYKVRKNRWGSVVCVADPGQGLVKYTKEEFLSHWLSTSRNGEKKCCPIHGAY